METPRSDREEERLAALYAYELLDTRPEAAFQDIARLAAQVCQMPIAVVALADRNRHWFKAKVGVDAEEMPFERSFCAYTIRGSGPFIVPDASVDARFIDSPVVIDAPYVRTYAGVPLTNPDGFALGSLCVLDRVPRELTAEQQDLLRILADRVMGLIELHRRKREAEVLEQQRAQAETALQSALSRLTALIANLRAGVLVEDEDRRIALVNAEFCRMFRVPSLPEALIGRNCAELALVAAPLFAEPEQFVQTIGETLSARQLTTTTPIRMADGRILERDYVPIFAQDAYRGHLWVYRDVTARERAVDVLRESEARMRMILDTALDAIVTVDMQTIVTVWNRQAEAIFGWPAEEAIGRSGCDLIVPPLSQELFRQGMREFLATGDGPNWHRRRRVTMLRRNGDEFSAELSIVPLKAAGAYTFTAFIRDISLQKRNEDQLRANQVNLTRQAQEIRQALELAERASRLKSEFVATMSHEIRTPLNGVIGMTGLLLDSPLSPDQRELAETARASAESLLDLVSDILDFSRIEAGKLKVESQPFDLHAVMMETLQIVSLSAQGKGLELTLDYAPDAPRRLIGDAGRIRQILVNLAGNAVKFTSRGRVVLTVMCLYQAADCAQMRVSVQDTGIGISAEQLPHIFEPFTQADASTTRRYGGAGLGLAICHRLAQMMGAILEAQSTPGAGSTFTLIISLPLVKEASAPAGSAGPAHPQIQGEQAAQTARLLLVEDSAVNRRVVQLMLEKQGHHIDMAANGLEALRMLEQTAYDAVLMDCQMPEMDGFEATRQIRAREPAGHHIPIIALTASALERDRQLCLAAGMDDFLAKPIRISDLNRLLARYLHR